MPTDRVLHTTDFFQSAPGEPLRIVMAESSLSTVVAWHVEPGQAISGHRHPAGQDTWIVLSGEAVYFTDAEGTGHRIRAGDVAIAEPGAVHGALNVGSEPFRFVSVVAPPESGFEPVTVKGNHGPP
ncbi:MAG: cupin domain-containing protein [Hydrogenophaga sp.]|jgi:quercetin dioxygenase-like cupin family protein|nr:cupin domain-containing protein [Hydrogenophaga sp.]